MVTLVPDRPLSGLLCAVTSAGICSSYRGKKSDCECAVNVKSKIVEQKTQQSDLMMSATLQSFY